MSSPGSHYGGITASGGANHFGAYIGSQTVNHNYTGGYVPKEGQASQPRPDVPRASAIREIQDRLNLANPNAHFEHLRHERTSRVHGTCEWIHDSAEYERWQTNEALRLLLITGRRGTGKTELIMYLIERLRAEETLAEDDSSRVLFFLCSSSDHRRSSSIGVLQGLLYHLCKNGRFLQYLVAEYEQYRPPKIDILSDFAILWSVFDKCLKDATTTGTILIIDGLDECDEASRKQLLKCLLWLAQGPNRVNLRMILSCRQERYVTQGLLDLAEHLVTTPTAIGADINRFIRERVEDLARSIGYSDRTKRELEEQLLAKHGDTFLWLEIVTRHIRNTEPSEEDVIEHIRGLPQDLQELYDRMLKQGSGRRFAETYFLLSLLSVCYRPLSKDEVIAALDLSSPTWSVPANTRLHNNEQLFNQCSDLIVVDSENNTVRFFNESVREYLTGSWHKGQSLILLQIYGLALLCLLTIPPCVSNQLLTLYTGISGICGLCFGWWMLRSTQTPHFIDFPTMLALMSLLPGLNGVRLRHHISTTYAHFWMFRVAFKQLRRAQILDPEQKALTEYGEQYLHKHAAASIHLTRWLFPWRAERLNRHPSLRDLWLRHAAASGGQLVQELLDAGANPNALDHRGWTALKWAVADNNLAVTQQLLRAGANPDQKDPTGESILMWTIGQAVQGVVYENIDLQGDGFSALMDAPGPEPVNARSVVWPCDQHQLVENERGRLIQVLITHSRLLDAVDTQSRTALNRAAGVHNWRAVLDLLHAGANANQPDLTGTTPLLSMLRAPRSNVIFRDVNVRQSAAAFLGSFLAPRKQSEPATQTAREPEVIETVRDEAIAKLLEATQDLDAADLSGRTALSYAAENGLPSIVATLLKGNRFGKPSPTKVDAAGRSPLMWACGHPKFRTLKFERLNIAGNAHVYLGAIHFADAERLEDTNLAEAASPDGERFQIVVHLLDCSPNVNDAARDGQTAVSLAKENGLNQIVHLLLSRGAELADVDGDQLPENPDGLDMKAQDIAATGNARLHISLPLRMKNLSCGGSASTSFIEQAMEGPRDRRAMAKLAGNAPHVAFGRISAAGNSMVVLGSGREECCHEFGREIDSRLPSGCVKVVDVSIAGSARWHCDLNVPEDWAPDFAPSLEQLIALPNCTFSEVNIAGSAKVEMGNTVVVSHGEALWAVTSQHPGNSFRRIAIAGNARVRTSLFTAMQANGIARWTIVALLGLIQSQHEPDGRG